MDDKRRDKKLTFLDWIGISSRFQYEKARWLGPVVGVFLGLLLAYIIFAFLGIMWRAAGVIFDQTSNLAHMAGASFLFAGLISAPFVTWRAVIAQTQARTAEQGLITDRINKAVENLGARHENGDPNIEVRLGGIFALERVAQDSLRDHTDYGNPVCVYPQ